MPLTGRRKNITSAIIYGEMAEIPAIPATPSEEVGTPAKQVRRREYVHLSRKVAEDLQRGYAPAEGERLRLKELAMDFGEEDERFLLLHSMLQDALEGLPDTDPEEILELVTEVEMHPSRAERKLPDVEG